MIASARERILASLPEDAAVLDVGGWAVPFPRADWVIDLMPYATRGEFGYDGDPAGERFTEATWVTRDICDRAPWPFADDQFDFVICSHTLEDVRDPVYVCAEIARVGRAGYVEVPSRLIEQSWGVQGDWVGWGHHHWLIDRDGDGLRFYLKPHHLGRTDVQLAFPPGFAAALAEADTVVQLWWDGDLPATEAVDFDPAAHIAYLRAPLEARGLPAEPPRRRRRRG